MHIERFSVSHHYKMLKMLQNHKPLTVPSAKSLALVVRHSEESLIQTKNSSNPRIKPEGPPALMCD